MAERFIETTLDLIAEEGGSYNVNLREISRRIGCAHTNVYNYFGGYQDLLWAAFRRTLTIYGAWLTSDLDDSLAPHQCLQRVLENLATFPQAHPGLYRFIASDPLPTESIPEDVLLTVSRMKQWLSETLGAVAESPISSDDTAAIADIVLAYVDGETLNLINRRVVPGEDVPRRIVDNALRIYGLLVRDAAAGGMRSPVRKAPNGPYPILHLPDVSEGA
jgi:AcrR family transcriptional regulator